MPEGTSKDWDAFNIEKTALTVIPGGAAGMKAESIVLCYQIRTLDKRWLIKPLGELDNAVTRAEVITALSFQLALNR